MDTIHLFGVKVNRLTMSEALDAVEGFLKSGGGHHIVTADSSALVLAQRDPELRRIINQAALVTPDSFGVTWAARRLGRPIADRVPGVEMMERLCERCAASGRQVFFLGAAPGVAAEAAARLSQRFPGLRVAGTHHGYFRPDEEERIVAEVAGSGAEILFVAMGIPKQEKWIARWLPRLGVSVAIGVGGSLDVFAGRVRRAPLWMQRCNMEWLYRLVTNPRKISKVKTLPVLVMMTLAAGREGGRSDDQ